MSINFKVIYLETNQGHGNARRCSVDNCTNELVALMDADDISYLDRFEKQLEVLKENSSIDIIGGQITEFIDTPSNIIGIRKVPLEDLKIKEYMKKRCPMNQVSVIFKKSFYKKVGGYIDWFCEEDYYLWIRMAENNGIFANVKENLVNVRIGDAMSSRRGGMKYFLSEARIQKYMLKKKIISLPRCIYNILIRFGGEVILTNKLRTILFKKLRTSIDLKEVKMKREYIVKSKKNYPKFSVAMCVYEKDNPKWFDEALESIFKQTLPPDEVILVVDGPIPKEIENIIVKYKNI